VNTRYRKCGQSCYLRERLIHNNTLSAYSNKKIAELRQLCQQRGLQYSGLRRAQLINLLVDNGNESELAVDEMEQPTDDTVNNDEERLMTK